MNVNSYILSIIDRVAEPVPIYSETDQNIILSKILSKKYRKYKADDQALELCIKAVNYAQKHKKPIKISLLFGGYKLWRFDEAPFIEWAEFFSMAYYINWLKTIAAIYPPGVEFEYYSQDICVSSLNGFDFGLTKKYTSSFLELINFFEPLLPDNVQFSYICHSEKFTNHDQYLNEIEVAKKAVLEEHGGELPELTESQLKAIKLNIKNTALPRDELRKIELLHQAIFKTSSILNYLSDDTIIPISPTPFPGLVILGSTKSSISKFWVGVGALKAQGDIFRDIVLTPNQLTSQKTEWRSVSIPRLNGSNFSRIRVIP